MYAICCYAAELTQRSALALVSQPLLHRKLPAWVYSHVAMSTPWNGCESQMVPAEIYPFSSLVILQAGRRTGLQSTHHPELQQQLCSVLPQTISLHACAHLFSLKMRSAFTTCRNPSCVADAAALFKTYTLNHLPPCLGLQVSCYPQASSVQISILLQTW